METILVDAAGGVRTITLNRPKARNAMNLAMVLELRQALSAAEADGQTRVLVLRGAEGHFCAGADISEMAGARMRLAADPDAIVKVNEAFGDLCVAFANTPLALVAVLQGTVMGGGFGLACVADVALADDSAAFRLPETSLGVVPAQIAPFLVERLGYSQAKRLAVTGGQAGCPAGAGASAWCTNCTRPRRWTRRWPACSATSCSARPGALAATKALIAKARLHAPASLVHEAAETFSRAALSAEGTEGQTAFLQKRKANWMPQ